MSRTCTVRARDRQRPKVHNRSTRRDYPTTSPGGRVLCGIRDRKRPEVVRNHSTHRSGFGVDKLASLGLAVSSTAVSSTLEAFSSVFSARIYATVRWHLNTRIFASRSQAFLYPAGFHACYLLAWHLLAGTPVPPKLTQQKR